MARRKLPLPVAVPDPVPVPEPEPDVAPSTPADVLSAAVKVPFRDSCASCRYWSAISRDLGRCHRYPPVIVFGSQVGAAGPVGVFPATLAETHCHEFASTLPPT